MAELGEISVVFTAAGVSGARIDSHEISRDDWYGVLDINLSGTFFTIRAALPSLLRRGGGSIVTCGSTSSFVATQGGLAPYRASKGGVKMLTQTLRSLERDGLVTRTVTPTVPVTVTYELTSLGLSLQHMMRDIKMWAEAHMDEVLANREEYDTRAA